jgi:hypothetical protein
MGAFYIACIGLKCIGLKSSFQHAERSADTSCLSILNSSHGQSGLSAPSS